MPILPVAWFGRQAFLVDFPGTFPRTVNIIIFSCSLLPESGILKFPRTAGQIAGGGGSMLVVNDRITIPLSQFTFSFARSSGPGGQHVNKVNTKVTLHWPVAETESLSSALRDRFCTRYRRRINKQGELVLRSQRFRDRGRNVADCLQKLRQMILDVSKPPQPRKKTKPTRSSKERRLKSKRLKSNKKQLRRPPTDRE